MFGIFDKEIPLEENKQAILKEMEICLNKMIEHNIKVEQSQSLTDGESLSEDITILPEDIAKVQEKVLTKFLSEAIEQDENYSLEI